jgi:ketosteroid isomerase-like protein
MASANVELVRSICTAWQRGDFGETVWADPEIEYVFADGPTPGTWTGMARMGEGFREFAGAWEDYRQVPDAYRELDEERVLVLSHAEGRGKRSGVEIGQIAQRRQGANLFHVRAGRVTRIVNYFDRDRALADLGLPSETG